MMVSDLDTETGVRPSTTVSIASLPAPKATETSDSKTRNVIANWLLVLLAAIVVVAFGALFVINYAAHSGDFAPPATNAAARAAAAAAAEASAKRLMDLMNVVFGPVVTLFSSVVGFYFGARTAQEGASAQSSNNPSPTLTTKAS